MKRQTKRFYVYAILTIGIMIVIFLFSNQNETKSEAVSDSALEWVLQESTGWMPTSLILFLEKRIRKVAHFLIYCALGITSCLTAHEYRSKRVDSAMVKNIIAWIICVVYAGTDEIHQRFVPGRSGQFSDVCLDSAGALAGVLLMYAFFALKYHKFKK